MQKCQNCGKNFDPADRATSTATEGAVQQIKYCCEKCARSAENRRAYQKRKTSGGKK